MSYESDAAYDDYIAKMFEEFREEHGEDIAADLAAQEIIVDVVAAHRTWWPKTEASVTRAKARLAEGHPEEAVFHVGRAFDGYVQNVLVRPLLDVLVRRFERELPANFPVRARDMFRSVNGLGSTETFSAYAIAVISQTPAIAEGIIGRFRGFVSLQGARGAPPVWSARNSAFHEPGEVNEATAREMVERVGTILAEIVAEAEHRVREERLARERIEFSPARAETLAFLAALYDADATRAVEEYLIAVPANGQRERAAALLSLNHQGYVESCGRDPEWLMSRTYRLTPEGRRYFAESVVHRLGAGVWERSRMNAGFVVAPEMEAD